jgi:hypothetical protein
LKEEVAGLILDLKNQTIKVKVLRCNDAGESKALKDLCRDKGL